MSSQLNVPSAPPGPSPSGRGPDIPREYGVTRLAIMPRDPGWLHAYWEVAPYTWTEAEKLFGEALKGGRPVLRFFLGDSDGTRGHDVDVRIDARSWYVHLPSRAGQCRAELGLVLADGRFALLAVSNEIWMPAGRVSDRLDGKWVALQEEWRQIYELSGGGRLAEGSMDTARAMAQHWEFLSISSWPSIPGREEKR
jgi:uncharacterized protein